ncbi:MAG: heparinase II/III family protein [Clostridia bacterium]|nr:heparinase II/III family protein [Clostridia bacterium]
MNLLDKKYNPDIWQRAKDIPALAPAIESLKKSYEEYCIGEIPTTKFSHFRLFADIGDRTTYQEPFFHRQHRMFTCALLCLIYPENEEYLTLLQDTIFEICDLYVWALPAHMPSITENNNTELDLDACTIAMALAIIKRLLGERLHPLIKSRIDAEIDRRIVTPFLEKDWHWEYRANNWTTVCAGAVGCTLMLNRPDVFEQVKDRINKDMLTYVDAYEDDGVCTEGAGYWGYGFGYYVTYADMLRSYSNGECNLLAGEKIKSIATFYQKMILDENIVVTYGDCGLGGKMMIDAGLVYKLKSIFGDIYELPPMDMLSYGVHYFPFLLDAFICYDEKYSSSSISRDCEYFMANQGWYVKRTPSYSFSCRGGTNGESHNHNDVGSFIFCRDDKQVFCDIGGRPYTRQYFADDTRYTFLETSSRGHNVPIINGQYQANIRDTRSYTKYENGVISIDFAELYDIDGLKLTRHLKPDETGVTITDCFDGASTFVERLITYFKPEISGGVVVTEGVRISFDSSLAEADYDIETRAITLDADGNIEQGQDVYCINLKVKNPKNEFSFRVEVV